MNVRRRAYSLLLAIVLIGAVGVTLGLMARQFVASTRTVRAVALDVRVSQLVAGGRAWIEANPEACSLLAVGEDVELPVQGLLPPKHQGSLTIARLEDARLEIHARVLFGRQAVSQRVTVSR